MSCSLTPSNAASKTGKGGARKKKGEKGKRGGKGVVTTSVG